MRFIATALLAPVLAAGVALGAPGTAEARTPGQPDATGTYTLNRTSAYLLPDDTGSIWSEDRDFVADFKVTETSSSNSVLAVRTINQGDGSIDEEWTSGSTITLRYTEPGTFTPTVTLHDEDGDVTTVRLATIKVIKDTFKPVVTITRPRNATKTGAWKVVRGTVTDVGTGVAAVAAMITQKRGKVWWAYDFSKKKWVKGYRSPTMTENRAEVMPFFASGPIRAWTTPTIRGMKKGVVRVHALAVDQNDNLGEAPIVTQKVR